LCKREFVSGLGVRTLLARIRPSFLRLGLQTDLHLCRTDLNLFTISERQGDLWRANSRFIGDWHGTGEMCSLAAIGENHFRFDRRPAWSLVGKLDFGDGMDVLQDEPGGVDMGERPLT